MKFRVTCFLSLHDPVRHNGGEAIEISAEVEAPGRDEAIATLAFRCGDLTSQTPYVLRRIEVGSSPKGSVAEKKEHVP